MFNRLKQKVYYCYRLRQGDVGYQEGLQTFRPPVPRWLNLRAVSGEAIIVSGGELSQQRLIAKIPTNGPDQYFENDILFIEKAPPLDFDPIDTGANYRVVYAPIGHSVSEIVLEKMV